MHNFTPFSAFFGGCLIGLSAALLLYFNGRVAGISGMMANIFHPDANERHWRLYFLGGLIASALVFSLLVKPQAVAMPHDSVVLLIVSGILVGWGTRLGNGCTSGHAVCGLARFSKRSAMATLTFMSVAMLTVFVVRHVIGG